MLNFYDLIKIFGYENPEAITAAKEDFINDFQKNFKSLSLTEKEREKNLTSFYNYKDTMIDKENNFIVATPTMIISPTLATFNAIQDKIKLEGKKQVDIYKHCKAFFEGKRKPVDSYIHDSIAIAKSLGFRACSKDFYLDIDGNYYNFDLVYTAFNSIGDPDKKHYSVKYELCYPEWDEKHPALMISCKNGIAFILPMLYPAKYECSFSTLAKKEKALETALNYKIA